MLIEIVAMLSHNRLNLLVFKSHWGGGSFGSPVITTPSLCQKVFLILTWYLVPTAVHDSSVLESMPPAIGGWKQWSRCFAGRVQLLCNFYRTPPPPPPPPPSQVTGHPVIWPLVFAYSRQLVSSRNAWFENPPGVLVATKLDRKQKALWRVEIFKSMNGVLCFKETVHCKQSPCFKSHWGGGSFGSPVITTPSLCQKVFLILT